MTEIATEVSTEIAETVTTVSNTPNLKASDVLFYGLMIYFLFCVAKVSFQLFRFLYNMSKLEKIGIYIENLTQEQIDTIVKTGKIETIDGVSFSLTMQKNVIVSCPIVHKTQGRGRNEIIIFYNNEEYGIVIPEADVNKYQIGDTVNVKLEILVTENNTETVKTLMLEDNNNETD